MSKKIETAFLLFVALLFVLSMVPAARNAKYYDSMHLLQVCAWLEGKWNLSNYMHDVAVYQDKYYSPFPPFPALLLTPFVVILGLNYTNTVIIALFFTWLNILLLHKVLQKINQTNVSNAWWIVAFFAGTGYWWACISSNSVYYFSHIVAVTALIAMLYAMQFRLFWLAACMLAIAFLTRQMTIFFYILFLFSFYNSAYRNSFKQWGLVNLPIVLGVIIYLAYNYVRFESPFETGYKYVSSEALFHAELVKKYGIFHIIYVPYNFYYMFLQGFSIEMSPPFYWKNVQVNPYGTSLIAASPFVLLAFFANYKNRLNIAAAVSVLIILTFTLMYQNNGWVQYNTQRFTLDFLPVLMLLVIDGARNSLSSKWIKGLIVYAVLLNVITFIALFMEKINLIFCKYFHYF